MLLQPSDNKSSREPDLPLDTPEQIRHSLEVDAARESRASVRKTEGEASAIEIANKRASFALTKERTYLAVGLLLLSVFLICAVCLWAYGEKTSAVYLLGAGSGAGGVGGARAVFRQRG
jgi:hypothetical protein